MKPSQRQLAPGVRVKEVALFPDGTLVTGSAGFLGSHLVRAFSSARWNGDDSAVKRYGIDILDAGQLEAVLPRDQVRTVFHLAGSSAAVIPKELMSSFLHEVVKGALNVLDILQPRRLVFASSCAVYGDTSAGGARTDWSEVHPVGLYGLGKVAVEIVLKQWAEETGGEAIAMRLGNVVGEACGGVIRYLVRHAVRFPDGSTPARMRGNGQIVRDYVPVDYVIRAMTAALERDWPCGACVPVNIGSGRGISNGEIAERVCKILARFGYTLRIEWERQPAPGEAWQAVLDVSETAAAVSALPPTTEDVWRAVEEGVLSNLHLLSHRQKGSGAPSGRAPVAAQP